jgi:hypothetical protein
VTNARLVITALSSSKIVLSVKSLLATACHGQSPPPPQSLDDTTPNVAYHARRKASPAGTHHPHLRVRHDRIRSGRVNPERRYHGTGKPPGGTERTPKNEQNRTLMRSGLSSMSRDITWSG